MNSSVKRTGIVFVLALVSTGACRSRSADQPDLGQVSGVVTMDGAPLAGVQVSFAPSEGRESHGITDAEGRYELIYIGRTKGAKVGSHRVYVTTPIEDESDPDARKIQETIPAKYNKDTILTAEVTAGKNTVDLELESR